MLNVTLNKFKVNNRNTRMMLMIFYPNFNKKSVACITCSKLRKKKTTTTTTKQFIIVLNFALNLFKIRSKE